MVSVFWADHITLHCMGAHIVPGASLLRVLPHSVHTTRQGAGAAWAKALHWILNKHGGMMKWLSSISGLDESLQCTRQELQ